MTQKSEVKKESKITRKVVVDISNAHTKALLKFRSFKDTNFYKKDFYKISSYHDGTPVGIIVSQREIRNELNNREHVPRKHERKLARQEAARINRGKGKSLSR